MNRVTKTDWKNKPLSTLQTTVNLNRTFTQDEMNYITMGLIPEEMEDKWFIYWEGDSLYFHRSWTGICMYVVRFHQEETCYRMYEADINRNSKEYREADGETDAEKINYLIDQLLLKRNEELSPNNNVLANWSFFGRAIVEGKKE